MELPSHPESEDSAAQHEPASTGSRATAIVLVIIGVLFAVFVILHLTGIVGPGAE
jgi:hypothetical protein